jgi:flagellar assembly factor FliW
MSVATVDSAALVEDGAVTTETDAVELPALELVGPLAGFPDHRRFALVALDEAGLLYALRSLEDPDLRFLVAPPAPFFPDYAPELDDAWVERLALHGADDALVLVVVTTGALPADATANLLAPVVVNRRTLRAAQVVLDQDLPLHAPLAG